MKKMKLQILFGVVLLGNAALMQGMTTVAGRARGAAGRFQSTGQMQQRFQSKIPETKPVAEEQEEEPQQLWGWFKSLFSAKPDDPEEVKGYMEGQLQYAIPFYETDRESFRFLEKKHQEWMDSGKTWDEWYREPWLKELELFKNERLRKEYKQQLAHAFLGHQIRIDPKLGYDDALQHDKLQIYKKMVKGYTIPEDTFKQWVAGGYKPLDVFEYIDETRQKGSIATGK